MRWWSAGHASRTRDGLFTEWAAALAFPDYFGRNWDALLDCLRDLVEERPHTLVVTDAAELLADEPPAQLATLLAVLGSVEGGSVEGGSSRRCGSSSTGPATAPAAAPAARRRAGLTGRGYGSSMVWTMKISASAASR